MLTLKERAIREGHDLDKLKSFVNYSYYRGIICFKTETGELVKAEDPRYIFTDRQIVFCPRSSNLIYKITINYESIDESKYESIYEVKIIKKNPSCLEIWNAYLEKISTKLTKDI